MTDRFRLELIVPKRLVGTIIEITDPECEVVLCESEFAHAKPVQRRRASRHKPHPANGRTGRDFFLEALSRNTKGLSDLQLKNLFKSDGRAATSVSSTRSGLVRDNLVAVDELGVTHLKETSK
jgi:hypothetical protein